MKKISRILFLAGFLMLLNSCYYDSYPEEIIIPPDPGEEVSYMDDIQPLWDQCIVCHKGQTPPDLRSDYSYESLLNGFVIPNDSDNSVLYNSLLGENGVSLMPPGSKWPDAKIDLVKIWIEQGAKNN